jgi:hypothetical protein
MMATMEVLIPDLSKKLRVESLANLKVLEAKDLEKEYTKKVFPWLESWRNFVNQDVEEKKDEHEEG